LVVVTLTPRERVLCTRFSHWHDTISNPYVPGLGPDPQNASGGQRPAILIDAYRVSLFF
jgi:hypothetical protein